MQRYRAGGATNPPSPLQRCPRQREAFDRARADAAERGTRHEARLTRSQAGELLQAASTLPPASRDAFLPAVDARLVGFRRRLTDDDVKAAIVTVLGDASITTPRASCVTPHPRSRHGRNR